MTKPGLPDLQDVLQTEFALAAAGGTLFGLPGGQGTCDCEWSDQPLSHVVLPDGDTRDPDVGHLPCRHAYDLLLPVTLGSPGNAAMVLPLGSEGDARGTEPGLRLERVRDRTGWREMKGVRAEVERAFGGDGTSAGRMVDHIRHRQAHLDGDWYLATADEAGNGVVGAAGLVVVATSGVRLGRLQDVDVLPPLQGRGLGNRLLDALIYEAERRGCAALSLRADTGDWPLCWYARRGFVEVGRWEQRTVSPATWRSARS